jgi:hypothetical protein
VYNKEHNTIVANCHVGSKNYAILKLYWTWHSSATTQSNPHQSVKERKKPTITSIDNFFNTGIPYKKKYMLKNSSLRILYSTSQRVIVH